MQVTLQKYTKHKQSIINFMEKELKAIQKKEFIKQCIFRRVLKDAPCMGSNSCYKADCVIFETKGSLKKNGNIIDGLKRKSDFDFKQDHVLIESRLWK